MSILAKPRRRRPRFQVGCPFCFEWVTTPKNLPGIFSGDSFRKGRCECGAVYVLDELGHAGGAALLEAQAELCEGDRDQAMRLETGVDVDVKTRSIGRPGQRSGGSRFRGGPMAWFVKWRDATSPPPQGK